ncbi:extracellular solute-binding protein [Paenibacillus thermoaerophilus]|uniref:Extracellular solute-binding protein n=1 Tax=Paenibacillus thermoaerophilus TaxID=1215385 RepID=A0ABW2V550_9BACL|nr:extracellular solute-binding protein [Paenibacillus thermoaerophilus]TMV17938.1 extracellular solute-binding protein [Paenibacillus thermoaerophilus]
MNKLAGIVLSGAVLAAGGTLAGCSGYGENGNGFNLAKGGGNAANKVENFTVTLRHTQIRDWNRKRLELLRDVVRAAEAEVPGAAFELDGVEEAVNRFDKLRAEMVAGNPPHIFDLFGGTDTRDYVKAGRLLDLTPIIEELGLKDKFYNLDEFVVDGNVYGLPMAGYAEGIFYNKKIFARYGVRPPTTWEELLAAAETFKANGVTPFAFASKDAWVINMMLNTMWVRTAGADSVEGFVTGRKKWTDEDVLEAFKKYELLVREGYFQAGNQNLSYAEQQTTFSDGKAAMMFDGSWVVSQMVDPQISKVAQDVGFINFPSMGGPGDGLINTSYSNGYGFSSKLSGNKLAAVKAFIQAMYNEQMQKRQLTEDSLLPAMKLTDISGVNPIISEVFRVTREAKGTFPAFDSIIQPKTREALEFGMQELLAGKSTAEEVVQAVQRAQESANRTSVR